MQVLALDLPARFLGRLQGLSDAVVEAVPADSLSAPLLSRLRPEAVFAPLLGPGYDILDLAKRLEKLGFGGHLYAVTPPLPDPAGVAREIRGHCTTLSFDIVTLQDDGDGS